MQRQYCGSRHFVHVNERAEQEYITNTMVYIYMLISSEIDENVYYEKMFS